MYIFFFRYSSGPDGFGYYNDYDEAMERMKEFENDSQDSDIGVEFGVARVEEVQNINWND